MSFQDTSIQIHKFIVVLNPTIFSIKCVSYQKLIISVHVSAHFDPLHEKEDTVIVHVCIYVRTYTY